MDSLLNCEQFNPEPDFLFCNIAEHNNFLLQSGKSFCKLQKKDAYFEHCNGIS